MTTGVRRHAKRPLMATACLILLTVVPALAQQAKTIYARASGDIVSVSRCSATEVCQVVLVTGTATHLGRFSGELHERIDIGTGRYTGTGLFSFPNGDSISTVFEGQAAPPDIRGTVHFAESHDVLEATGRLAGATGYIDIGGVATAAGKMIIEGSGVLEK